MRNLIICIIIISVLSFSVISVNNLVDSVGAESDPWFRSLGASLAGDNIFSGSNNFTGDVFMTNLTIINQTDTAVEGSMNASSFCLNGNGCVNNWTTDAGLWVLTDNHINPWSDYEVRASKINATNGYFTEINVSQNSIYVGGVKISSEPDNLLINDGVGNITAENFVGSGQYLTDINLSSVNGSAVFNDDVVINADLTVINSANFSQACFGIDCITNWDRWVNKTGDTMTGNLTVNGIISGNGSGLTSIPQSSITNGYVQLRSAGNIFNGSLYTYGANGSLSLSNSLFQVLGDEGSPRLQVQNGGTEQAGLLVRSWIVVNQNNTRLQQAQNNLCGDWGFIHIDCNTSSTGADMGVQDDFEVQGLAYFDNGLRAHAITHNPYIVTTDRGFKYSGMNGSYDTVDSFFCDYVSNNFVDTGGWIVINDDGHPYDGATADIDVWVNSSCVQLTNNPSWDDNFTNAMWKVKQSPEFINNYGGFFEFYVGNDTKSQFNIRTKNGTGDSSFFIETDAGVAQHTALNIQYDMNGFEGVNGLYVDMGTSEVFANKTATMMLMEGDGTHMIDSKGIFIDMEVVGSPVNSEIVGINVNPNVNKIIESSAPDTIRSAFYNDVNVTANVTNVGDDLTVFINDNDYLYFGANLNFTIIGVTLSTDSSQNLAFNYFYCNNTGGYTQFVMSDSTNGFKTSGILSFNNPANRGKCNTQINGTPFTNTNNYTYVVLQRTVNNVVTFPVIDSMTVSGGGTSFILQKNMLKLNPESAPPEMCNANFVGGIYVDTELNRPCYCDGSNWLSMADFTTICS